MRLSHLTTFLRGLNRAIASGKFQDISVPEVENHVKKGDILSFLSDRFSKEGELIDLSHPLRVAPEFNDIFERYLSVATVYERGVGNNGLCLLVALTVEAIDWEKLEQ